MELGLKDKVIMVAASSKGLGFGIAMEAAKEGAKISMCARNKTELEKASEIISKQTGSDVYHSVCDLSVHKDINKWISSTHDFYHSIDCLLVNAGGPPSGSFEDISEEQWNKSIQLTLLSSIRLINGVLPFMKKKGGSILISMSTSIKEPIENLVISNTLRSAVAGLAKSLSVELAKYKIRVNVSAPGRFLTERLNELEVSLSNVKKCSVSDIRKSYEEKIPLHRYGSVEEYAKVCVFLLSEAASYINGTVVYVDGGMMKSW